MTNSIAEECVDSRLNSPLDHSVSGSSGSGHDPKEFLKVVQEMFHNRRENYLKFLQIMEDYKAHRIEIVSVISEVEKLFKGNQRLILGFNAFLPKGCKIPLPFKDEHTTKNPGHSEAINFVKKLKVRFQGQEEVHASIIQIFNMHRLKQKCTTEVYQEVSTLLEGHTDLLEEFTQFLGNNASMRLEQQRRMEEKEKESNMFLGNNASMRLEQQRRLIEKEKESNTGTDRRDGDSHESDKGVHIQIDIKMHRISHKRKNSDHVDYPASHMSCCGVSPQEFHSCKKGNERLDKADTDQEASTCHSISKPIFERNFSACQRCTPSYYLLPKNYQTPASQRTELDASVLNDQCVSVAPKCDDYVSKDRHKNQFEELQLRFEDERFELDLLLSQAIRTTAVVEELLKEIHGSRSDNPISIEAHFTAQNIRCIEKIYGDHGLDMIEHLRNQPSTVLPVILARLKQKQEEWRRKRTEFNSVWRETLSGAQQVFLAKHFRGKKENGVSAD